MRKFILFIIMILSVVCYSDTMYVTVTGGGSGRTGVDWDHAFAMSDFLTDFTTNAEDGDVYYVAGGTYDFATHMNASALDASAASPIYVIGVKSGTTNEAPEYSDFAYGNDRPLFNCTTNSVNFICGDYFVVRNIRFVMDDTNGFKSGSYSRIINCKSANDTGTTPSYEAFTLESGSMLISSEASSTSNGNAIECGTICRIIGCYIHSSAGGIECAPYTVVNGCIIADNTVGIIAATQSSCTIINNTFHSCTTGITSTTSYGMVLINNFFDECSTPITSDGIPINMYDYNAFDGDYASNINVVYEYVYDNSDVTLGADYSLPSTASTLIGTGLMVGANQGISGTPDYGINIGADQDDNASGGTQGRGTNRGESQ